MSKKLAIVLCFPLMVSCAATNSIPDESTPTVNATENTSENASPQKSVKTMAIHSATLKISPYVYGASDVGVAAVGAAFGLLGAIAGSVVASPQQSERSIEFRNYIFNNRIDVANIVKTSFTDEMANSKIFKLDPSGNPEFSVDLKTSLIMVTKNGFSDKYAPQINIELFMKNNITKKTYSDIIFHEQLYDDARLMNDWYKHPELLKTTIHNTSVLAIKNAQSMLAEYEYYEDKDNDEF